MPVSNDLQDPIDINKAAFNRLINRKYRHWFVNKLTLDNFLPLVNKVGQQLMDAGVSAQLITMKFQYVERKDDIAAPGAYIYRILLNMMENIDAEALIAKEEQD